MYLKAVHRWAFYQLFECVTYKAELEGLVVKQVRLTRVSVARSLDSPTRTNRPSQNGQNMFGYPKRGSDVRAGNNAAKNIGL